LFTGCATVVGSITHSPSAIRFCAYPRDLATGEVPKDCCIRTPGHPPPHDVVDPLEHIAPR
jgi:hypothetical protein